MKPPRTGLPSSRREFLARTAAASAALLTGAGPGLLAAEGAPARNKIGGFSKPFQNLDYDETAKLVAEVGWDGIECALRKGGHVSPEKVEEELPRLVEALRKRKLEVLVIATDIRNAATPMTERVLRAAAKEGIKLYRLTHLSYDLSRPIPEQVAAIRAGFLELQALNRELGMCAAFENHSGPNEVGAPIWDIYEFVRGLDPRNYGVCLDVGHATIEGGLDWRVQFKLIEPWISSIYVKDFLWRKEGEKWQAKWCPLGEGMVSPDFVGLMRKANFHGPIIQHHEYPLEKGAGMIEAMKRDKAKLDAWLARA